MTDKEELGASLFSRSIDLMEDDPLEEIFALNLGDFISEYLISEDLANKIGKDVKDKTTKLKSQLKELVSIYSLDNTLCVLGFSSQDEYVVYNSIYQNYYLCAIFTVLLSHWFRRAVCKCGRTQKTYYRWRSSRI